MIPLIISAIISAVKSAKESSDKNAAAMAENAKMHRQQAGVGGGLSGAQTPDATPVSSLIRNIVSEKFKNKENGETSEVSKPEIRDAPKPEMTDRRAVFETRRAGYNDTFDPTQNTNISEEILKGNDNINMSIGE